MKTRIIITTTTIIFLTSLFVYHNDGNKSVLNSGRKVQLENEEQGASYQQYRWKYEADMIKDPATGKIPYHILEQELEFAGKMPVKENSGSSARINALNSYFPAGPNNIGGRTRALAYDVRYGTGGNQVILAGSVSGGIYRTSNGGTSWTRVSPSNEIHNVSNIVQDPRSGSQDTWYAGGGELYGNSADEIGAGFLAYGIYKSTDNGITWTRLPLNTITDINGTTILGPGTLEAFDNPFDFVHKLAVNPLTGDLYIAGHRRIIRLPTGSTSFQVVFGSSVTGFSPNGQCDVTVSPTGKVYVAFNGSAADFSLRGIWKSSTGNANSFTKLAGGSILGVDSVAGWRGNSYDFIVVGTSNFYDTRRTILALAPSNENILYVMYENGLTSASPDLKPEADFFKLDMTGGVNTWTNRSANMPDFPGGNNSATDPFTIQGGYDMCIAVKPDNPNTVFIGGTSLYRSTDGFATTANTNWIGGYHPNSVTASEGFVNLYAGSHADIHSIVFNPSNIAEVLCANDGGVQKTTNINTGGDANVVWQMTSVYQTLQYYNVSIDPETGKNNFIGGAQDNGTYYRDKTQVLGTAQIDSNNHPKIAGGDGGYTGISKINSAVQYVYTSTQFGAIKRVQLTGSLTSVTITPTGLTATPGTTGFGELVTNFKLNPDNTDDLYYVNFNRLFRTTNVSTVTSSGWTELTGISNTVSPAGGTSVGIRAIAFSRGPYLSTHTMYIGTTDGKIYRLDNPRTTGVTALPVNITPSGLTGNVQDIAVNPNDDNEIIAVVSNYNATSIWWTNNAKATTPTWKNAEGNLTLPSARSCAIVVKKDGSGNPVTEYYVGTSVGLYSSSNLATGTPVWQLEGSGVINFSVIQSLAYRPVDNVLLVGTHGNGMFYTSLGTPNFNPPTTTGINPIDNDKRFIKSVYPTINSNLVQYYTGDRFEIKKITVQLFNMQGQQLLSKKTNYQDGTIDLSSFAKGAYILHITSDDQKYRHVQKLIH